MSESNSSLDLTSSVNNLIDTHFWMSLTKRQHEVTSNCLSKCPTNFDINGVTNEEAACLKKCLISSIENSLIDTFK
jgi:hypothetical protein